MTAFRLNRSWLSRKGSSELEATFCQLSITVDDKNVSEFSDEQGVLHEQLDLAQVRSEKPNLDTGEPRPTTTMPAINSALPSSDTSES